MIYLIRHGETEFHKKNILQGHKDSKLTNKGKLTAKNNAKKLLNKNIKIIYTSDLGRCVQTANIINQYLKIKLIKTNKLRERNFGELNGKSNLFVKNNLNLTNLNHKAPKGESFNQMKSRILKFIKTKNNILIITHEGPLRAILSNKYKINPLSNKCNTKDYIVYKIKN